MYSVAGLPWPLAIAGLWLAGLLASAGLARTASRGARHRAPRAARPGDRTGRPGRLAAPAGAPDLGVRLASRQRNRDRGRRPRQPGRPACRAGRRSASGATPTSGLPASPAFTGGMWTAFVLALVLFGAYLGVPPGSLAAAARRRRGDGHLEGLRPLPVALRLRQGAGDRLAAAAAARGAAAGRPRAADAARPGRCCWRRCWRLVLFLRVGGDDLRALRWSPVGPTGHADQLETFRPLLAGQPTLFLGNDEFILWELAGSPVQWTAVAATPEVPLRPQKEWEYGQALDFDSVDAGTLNDYRWVVTPRDAASSAPPPQLHLVAQHRGLPALEAGRPGPGTVDPGGGGMARRRARLRHRSRAARSWRRAGSPRCGRRRSSLRCRRPPPGPPSRPDSSCRPGTGSCRPPTRAPCRSR